MKYSLSFLLLVICIQITDAQQHDNVWTLGYNSTDPHPDFGGINIYFSESIWSEKVDRELEFGGHLSASISNASGELRLMYNGCTLYDGNNNEVEGSETLVRNDTDLEQTWWCLDGYNTQYGAVLLPNPYDSLRYYLLYRDMVEIEKQPYYVSDSLYAASIYSDGEVSYVEWKEAIVHDTVSIAGLSAVKHANGIDWWILLKDEWENLYYKVLIDEQGISHHSTQYINDTPTTPNGGGPKKISPDGRYMVTVDPFYDFELFEVDRSDASLTPYLTFSAIPLLENTIIVDTEFSPSGEYLYVAHPDTLYQFDMTVDKEDFYDSRVIVGVRDSFVDPFPTNFWLMQRAPDGKIYMSSRNGGKHLHVIHSPDKKGLNCDFKNNDYELPAFRSFGLPYFPNFRLGPDPSWVSTTEEAVGIDIQVYPNPASDVVYIQADSEVERMELHDMSGRVLQVAEGATSLHVSDIANGIYVVSVWIAGQRAPQCRLVTIIH